MHWPFMFRFFLSRTFLLSYFFLRLFFKLLPSFIKGVSRLKYIWTPEMYTKRWRTEWSEVGRSFLSSHLGNFARWRHGDMQLFSRFILIHYFLANCSCGTLLRLHMHTHLILTLKKVVGSAGKNRSGTSRQSQCANYHPFVPKTISCTKLEKWQRNTTRKQKLCRFIDIFILLPYVVVKQLILGTDKTREKAIQSPLKKRQRDSGTEVLLLFWLNWLWRDCHAQQLQEAAIPISCKNKLIQPSVHSGMQYT